MSKKTANFRHFDEWSEQFKKFGEDVELTGVYFKHRRPMFVQRMTGYVKLNFTSTLPDGTEFTSTAKEFASLQKDSAPLKRNAAQCMIFSPK